jgi:prolyl 4-hydroxylase
MKKYIFSIDRKMSSNDNPIKLLDAFITDEECNQLIDTYKDKVQQSLVVGNLPHPSRTSSSYFLPQTDPVISQLRIKVAKLLDIPIENIEPIQFLRYRKGELYKYHHDFLKGDTITNQRVHTVLVYLNTLQPEDGGATSFFHYKQKISPKKGMGVCFRNMDEGGKVIEESLHAGEEILTDTIKYALNIWTRKHKY